MSDPDRCDACPVPAGRYCDGTRVRRYCELIARGEPGYADLMLRRSDPSRPPPSRPAGEGPAPPPPDPPLARAWRVIRSCPHRVRPASCGCPTCDGGPRHGERVTGDVCLACPVTIARLAERDATA